MDEAPLDDLYVDLVLPGTASEPGLSLHLVTSVNGAATGPDGRSGSLGGAADRLALRRVRDAADVVLVGGGTARHERYGPVGTDDERRSRRLARGLSPVPRLAVLTNNGIDAARLRGDGEPPIVLTANTDLEGPDVELAALDDPVTADGVLAALHERGLFRILCEGGPALARWLLSEDLVDELFLTVAPSIVGGQPRLLPDPLPDADLEVLSAAHHGNDVLVRYRVHAAGS